MRFISSPAHGHRRAAGAAAAFRVELREKEADRFGLVEK
jgi:hypothetical protein